MGVQAVSDAISGPSESDEVPSETDIERYDESELLRYCGSDLRRQYERIDSICANRELDERMSKRRQEESGL